MFRVKARRSESDGLTYWQIEEFMGSWWICAFDHNEEGYHAAIELAERWNFEDALNTTGKQ